MNERKGFLLVLLTAVVSGISIFANSFAVQGFNPFAFTFLKNAAVAVFLFSIIILLKELSAIRKLSGKQLLQLASIGLVGGSIPFLIFFYALKFTPAINAGFLHKTIFIWASLFAFLFIKERPSKSFAIAALLLLLGNFILFSISSFAVPELLVLMASLLWALELSISKNALKHLSGTVVAFGRMFFGSLFILAFLFYTGQLQDALAVSVPQFHWVLVSSCFLLAYVFTFYNGLKHLPVHKAASILLLAQPVTAFLSLAFLNEALTLKEAFGLLLVIAGILLAAGTAFLLSKAKSKGPSIAGAKN